MNTGTFVSLMAFYVALFVAAISLRDILLKGSTKWWRYVIFILVMYLWGIFGSLDVLMRDSSNSQSVKDINDTTRTAEQRLHFSIDSTRVAVIDSIQSIGEEQAQRDKESKKALEKKLDSQKLKPLLEISSIEPGEKNPVATPIDSFPKAVRLQVTVYNLRSGTIAYGTRKTFFTVYYSKGKIFYLGKMSEKITNSRRPMYYENNKFTKIKCFTPFAPPCLIQKNLLDTLYVFFELQFTDGDGNPQKPFRDLFIFTCEDIGKELVREQGKFNEIEDYLISKKYMEK
jgi:hypothetical protein